jgi:hypothetical protein
MEIAALMRSIGAVSAGGVIVNAPSYTPITPVTAPVIPQVTNNTKAPLIVNNNITSVKVNPTDVSNATLSAIKYGSVLMLLE